MPGVLSGYGGTPVFMVRFRKSSAAFIEKRLELFKKL